VVALSPELRAETADTALKLHVMIRERVTPGPVNDARCESCSFVDFCMPKVCRRKSVRDYLEKMMG
jgi:CRISPR-associated exonuclease Cas4